VARSAAALIKYGLIRQPVEASSEGIERRLKSAVEVQLELSAMCRACGYAV
jgi:hypothetical protein